MTVSFPTAVARNSIEPFLLIVPADYGISHALFDGKAFACDHRLVNSREAVRNDAVNGDSFSRTNSKNVAGDKHCNRCFKFDSVTKYRTLS